MFISELSKLFKSTPQEDFEKLLFEIFSKDELETLEKRWRILKMLNSSCTQRQIAKELNVSLCKVTRGAKILKEKNSIVKKFLSKGE